MSRAITTCHACRHQALNTFAALADVSIRPQPQNHPQRSWRSLRQQTWSRSISTSKSVFETQRNTFEPPSDTLPEKESKAAEPTPSQTGSGSIPWYLQVQTPEPPAPLSPQLALEELPPIPSDAPPILYPLLSHLSTQIGLDNLTLLDLRSVYPPPALGSNLLMILGTARSYKHLNTSADRFCRWLRSKYKLTPYADGLLGRNEMKLKLRRKARRMKLAQSVGNTVAMGATEGGDDGITTGWICVNVGAVDGVDVSTNESSYESGAPKISSSEQEEIEKDEEEYENPSDESEVIGFGTRDDRPRIAVQMFTEEKRIEMDLEGLWDARVQRRERKEDKNNRHSGAMETRF